MVDFYNRLLSGKPRAEALREAQLVMKEKYPDPYYWGAFLSAKEIQVLYQTLLLPCLKHSNLYTLLTILLYFVFNITND